VFDIALVEAYDDDADRVKSARERPPKGFGTVPSY
jgi:hypothetical protein